MATQAVQAARTAAPRRPKRVVVASILVLLTSVFFIAGGLRNILSHEGLGDQDIAAVAYGVSSVLAILVAVGLLVGNRVALVIAAAFYVGAFVYNLANGYNFTLGPIIVLLLLLTAPSRAFFFRR